MKSILDNYRNYFPKTEIPALFQYQEEAIGNLLLGRNTLCIIPTGGGKSLVYQLAGLKLDGLTLVVCPLKALMQEQVNYLNEKGIDSLALSSDIGFQEQRKILRKLNNSTLKFLYVSPERLQNYFFRAALLKSGKPIKQLVVDEAHCISQWGFDFRPEYSEIVSFVSFLKQNSQTPAICCLSATMSTQAVNDIIREFSITTPTLYHKNGVIRTELKINVEKVEEKKNEEQKWTLVINFLKKHSSKKAVIYCYSKKRCEELANRFNEEKSLPDRVADHFHAGNSEDEKTRKYELFKQSKINYLFATTAFGMGMNIPDIDCIIQYHLPKSIEEFYQQIGRGARDKNICPECNCLLLWSEENTKSNRKEILRQKGDLETIDRAIEHMNIKGTLGKIGSVSYSELVNAKINLLKYKFYLEKFGLIETLGEINGGPDTIRFTNDTPEWLTIKRAAIANSFILAAKKLNRSIQDLINYVYEQDLRGNVEFLPAMGKKIFLQTMVDEITDQDKQAILTDIEIKVNYQLQRFIELEDLCRSENPEVQLSKVFQSN